MSIACQTQNTSANNKREVILLWQYNSTDESFIYPIIKKYLCVPVAKLVPYHISPNLITIIGFIFTVLASLICYFKASLTFVDHCFIALFCFTAFFFDALDGEQGRKWKNDRRDIYVLTQLFDHGFDSLTNILNVYIFSSIVQLKYTYQILMFVMLNATFMISSLDYKANRCMRFELFNNPTESVILELLFIIFTGIYGPIQPFANWAVILVQPFANWAVILLSVQNYINNLLATRKIFLSTQNLEEKIECGINVIYCLLIFITPIKLQSKISYFLLISLVCHLITLNYIVMEIYRIHCCKQNMILLFPQFCLLLFVQYSENSIYLENIILGFNVILMLFMILQWVNHSNTICQALEIKFFWEMPRVNNNPYLLLGTQGKTK